MVGGGSRNKIAQFSLESESGFSFISLMDIKSGLSPLTTCVSMTVESRTAYIVCTLINVWLYLDKP